VVAMDERLEQLIRQNLKLLDKKKLEKQSSKKGKRLDFNKKKLLRLLETNNKFEHDYQKIKSKYESLDEFSRELFLYNRKLADAYVDLVKKYSSFEIEKSTLNKQFDFVVSKYADDYKKWTNGNNLKQMLNEDNIIEVINKLPDKYYKKVVEYINNELDEKTFSKIAEKIAKDELGKGVKKEIEKNQKLSKETERLNSIIENKDEQLNKVKLEIENYKIDETNYKKKISNLEKLNSTLVEDYESTIKKYSSDIDNAQKEIEEYHKKTEKEKKSLIEKIKDYESREKEKEKQHKLDIYNLNLELNKSKRKEKKYKIEVIGLEKEIGRLSNSKIAKKKPNYKLDVNIDTNQLKKANRKTKEPIKNEKVAIEVKPEYIRDVSKKVKSLGDILSKNRINTYTAALPKKEDIQKNMLVNIPKPANNYHNRINNIKIKENSSLNDIVDILSGDYRNENGKRAWSWKDRQNEIKNYFRNNDINYSNNDKQKIEDIIDVVESNKYATKKHREKLDNIYENIKYKGESKVKRFFKRNWKKVVAGGLVAATAIGTYFGAKAYNNKPEQISKSVDAVVEYVTKEDVSEPISVDSVIEMDENENDEAKYGANSSKDEKTGINVTYKIKKGDCIWNVAKDYISENGIKADNKIIIKVANQIAQDNGKSELGKYKGLEKDAKNPNLIYPNDELLISEKVDNLIEEYKTKGDANA
jgi:hypothetical protein